MIHTRELELAARDFIDSSKPDFDLSTRVNLYTNWEGELNEIVHYSKMNVRGIDVLVNMVLSDYCGDTRNIETIFNPNYKFFGVRAFTHDVHDYCIVVIYAEEIYSSLNSALYTSEHIDEELLFERETLSRKIAEKNDYHYTSRYARDHQDVRFNLYLNDAQRSKRKVKLTEYEDGDRTFTVIRRDSLERNPKYSYHDDAEYQYVDPVNVRFTHVPDHARPPKNYFNLGKGERIVRQTITDVDKDLYEKRVDRKVMEVKHDFYGDAHRHRYTVPNWKDYDAPLYYGDLNDVTRFEEEVIDNYTTIIPESCPGNHNDMNIWEREASGSATPPGRGTFRRNKTPKKVKTHMKSVHEVLHAPENRLHTEVKNPNYSFRSKRNTAGTSGIDVSFRPATSYHMKERESSNYSSIHAATNYGRFSRDQEVPLQADPAEIKRTASFRGTQNYQSPQQINSYRMAEEPSFREPRSSLMEISPTENRRSSRGTRNRVQQQVRTTTVGTEKGKFGDFGRSPEDSIMNRPTSYSNVHKRRTNADTSRGSLNHFEIDSD